MVIAAGKATVAILSKPHCFVIAEWNPAKEGLDGRALPKTLLYLRHTLTRTQEYGAEVRWANQVSAPWPGTGSLGIRNGGQGNGQRNEEEIQGESM